MNQYQKAGCGVENDHSARPHAASEYTNNMYPWHQQKYKSLFHVNWQIVQHIEERTQVRVTVKNPF